MELYHGTNKPHLKSILPNNSGYVHATSELVFSLIFSSRERNSLTAKWGMNKDGIPYFCEKVEGIFDSLYGNLSSYIYILDRKKYFPNIDEEAVNTALAIYKKYGKERALKDVKKLRPDILKEVETIIENL